MAKQAKLTAERRTAIGHESLGVAGLDVQFLRLERPLAGDGRRHEEPVPAIANRRLEEFLEWQLAEAKNRLSEVVNKALTSGPQRITRRGDEFTFTVNGQEALRKTVKTIGRNFQVMLYGYSSSENNWDSVRVVAETAPKP